MTAIARRYPLARIAIRSICEFIVSTAADLGRAFGSHERGVIFCALLRGTESYVPVEERDASQAAPAIAINTLAGGLHRPFETVRQQVHRLAASGWCEVTPGGVIIPPHLCSKAEVQAVLDMVQDRMVRMVEDLRDIGYPMPPSRPDAEGAEPAILRRNAIELFLALWEIASPYHGGPIKALVYSATMVANARPITFDRTLSHRYSEADQPPPEAERAPLRTNALARAVGLPYPTARRHVEAQIARGRMVRRPEGVLISDQSLQDPGNQAVSAFGSMRLATLLRSLQSAGFVFEDPAQSYARGRPRNLDFTGD